MKGFLRLLAVTAIVVTRAAPAAADSGWSIDRFHADITIRENGNLNIIEAVDVDFAGLSKHGILRDIPTRYRYDDTRDRRYGIFVHGVTDAAGRSITYQVSTGEAMTEIKIGDPGRTVTCKQTYRIDYTDDLNAPWTVLEPNFVADSASLYPQMKSFCCRVGKSKRVAVCAE